MSTFESLLLSLSHTTGQVAKLQQSAPVLVIVVRATIPSRVAPASQRPALQGLLGDPAQAGTIVTVEVGRTSAPFVDFIAMDEVLSLFTDITDLGLPQRPAEIRGVNDTSQTGCITELYGSLSGRGFALTVSQQSSGYRGPQAGAFARLMRRLLFRGGIKPGAVAWEELVAWGERASRWR